METRRQRVSELIPMTRVQTAGPVGVDNQHFVADHCDMLASLSGYGRFHGPG